MKKLLSLLLLFVSIYSISAKENYVDPPPFYRAFLNYSYTEAFTAGYKKALSAKTLLEFNSALYQICETPEYPEQKVYAYTLLKKLDKSPFASDNTEYLSTLYTLSKDTGADADAEQLKNKLHIQSAYTAYGPFYYTNKDDFSRQQNLAQSFNSKKTPITPFKLLCDLDGVAHIKNYYPNKDNTLFYLKTEYSCDSDSLYDLIIGKTGFTEIYINNIKVGADFEKHAYSSDQYIIRVKLKEGINSIIVKTASNTDNETLFSLKVLPSSKRFNSIISTNKLYDTVELYSRASHSLSGETRSFYTGYLYYHKKMYGQTKKIEESLSKINSSSTYYIPALYYRALAAPANQEKVNFLNSALTQKEYTRLFRELSLTEIKSRLYDQALGHAEHIRKSSKDPYIYDSVLYHYHYFRGWYFAAEKFAEDLNGVSPLTSLIYLNELYYDQGEYTKAYKTNSKLISFYPHTPYYLYRKYMILLNRDLKNEAISTLYTYIDSYPEDPDTLTTLAKLLIQEQRNGEALTALASSRERAPMNWKNYYLLSELYLNQGMKDLAHSQALKAQNLFPDSNSVNTFINDNFESEDFLSEYIQPFDLEAAVKESDKKYSSEPASVLLNESVEKILKNGSTIKRIRKIYKVYNPKTAENLQQVQFSLNNGSESLLSLRCSVSINGKTYEADNIQTQSLSDPESRLYYDITLYTVNLPVFDKDALITVDYTTSTRSAATMRGYYGARFYFSDYYPTLYGYNRIVSLLNKDLIYTKSPILTSSVSRSKKGSETIYSFTAKDLPSVKYESNYPPYFSRVPSISYSSFKNWDDFYSWYNHLLDSRIIMTSEMKESLAAITEGLDTDEEKISAVYKFITNRIRYVGFEIGIGGIQPRYTNSTYESRLGDCKDIALLLTAFYRELGMDASLSLIRTTSSGYPDTDFPYIGNFNHAICYLDYKGGLFLDGTVDNAGIFDLPEADRDTDILVIKKDNYRFIRSDSSRYTSGKTNVESQVTIASDGSASLYRKLTKIGPDAAYFRNTYESDSKKIEYLGKYWNYFYPGASVSNYSVTNLKSSNTLYYDYSITLPYFINTKSNTLLIPAALLRTQMAPYLAPTIKRESMLSFPAQASTHTSTTYILPEEFTIISVPDNITVKRGNISYTLSFKRSQNTITVNTDVQYGPLFIPPSEYKEFRDSLLKIDLLENNYIQCRRVQ
jgi:transglutaminase-like putative cysteine protease